MNALAALIAGTIFGAGLAISGMTEPGNVIQFLNLDANWSPALMIVMGSALIVAMVGFKLIERRTEKPLFADAYSTPGRNQIDQRLLVGAALFGLGWGVAGYCPGPAFVGAFALDERALLFLLAYLVSTRLFDFLRNRATTQQLAPDG